MAQVVQQVRQRRERVWFGGVGWVAKWWVVAAERGMAQVVQQVRGWEGVAKLCGAWGWSVQAVEEGGRHAGGSCGGDFCSCLHSLWPEGPPLPNPVPAGRSARSGMWRRAGRSSGRPRSSGETTERRCSGAACLVTDAAGSHSQGAVSA